MSRYPAHSSQPEALLPAEVVSSTLASIARQLPDPESALLAARFPYDPLASRVLSSRMSPRQYNRLTAVVATMLGDESGGLMPDAATPKGSARLILLSMINSPNLGVALRRGIEFNATCRVRRGAAVSNRLWVDADGREATLSYECCPGQPEVQYRVLYALALWLRVAGWLVGQQIDLTSASCTGPESSADDLLRHYFRCPVAFGQARNAVTFSARHLEAEPVRDEEELEAFLRRAPYFISVHPPLDDLSVTHRIRAILGTDFREEMPSFDELTGLLNMSARTLRRRLEKEGTSYQRIKDNARRDVAINLLCREGMTVSEVAERVGFSDPSAFHRSFKKWTGQSPGSFR